MKRSYTPYVLVMIMLISAGPGLKSQDLFINAAGERIQACTDRTMYISGEKVLFSVQVYNEKDHFAKGFSRICYCELITPDGKMLAAEKYLLTNSFGEGCLTIPRETISGIYFLKFYTRFMRNISTAEYKYIMLKIINPDKTEVLSGEDTSVPGIKSGESIIKGGAALSVNFQSGKKTFSTSEEIRLNITIGKHESIPVSLCLSVIPESTYHDSFYPEKNKQDSVYKGVYFPETRGVSLSGHLIAKGSGKPVTGAKVDLSIIGNKDILVVRTDTSGRFFFALPDYHGNKDIFLYSDDFHGITPEILIDNDFCSRPVFLPSPLFTLDEKEMKAAYKLAVNFRLTSVFGEDSIVNTSSPEQNNPPFYGNPSEVLTINKYIDLPTLDEYFTQLPSVVNLRKIQGRKQFRFFTVQEEMSAYDPLVLVDWVAVNDIEKILAMSPHAIERIELVNSLYIKGNITYGGIISFVSRKNDFAGIDLPKSGTFINYCFLEDCTETLPVSPLHMNIPDSRNTVYWNPAVHLNDDGTSGISFKAPGTPGKYYILLRGMGINGEVILTEETIDVAGN